MIAVIDRKRYDTNTADCLADNEYADGSNRLQTGRASFLYRTPKGAYFAFFETCWQGEHDSIEPLDLDEAEEMYARLPSHYESYEEAFPAVQVEDA